MVELAFYLKKYNNMFAFFAVMMGIESPSGEFFLLLLFLLLIFSPFSSSHPTSPNKK